MYSYSLHSTFCQVRYSKEKVGISYIHSNILGKCILSICLQKMSITSKHSQRAKNLIEIVQVAMGEQL